MGGKTVARKYLESRMSVSEIKSIEWMESNIKVGDICCAEFPKQYKSVSVKVIRRTGSCFYVERVDGEKCLSVIPMFGKYSVMGRWSKRYRLHMVNPADHL